MLENMIAPDDGLLWVLNDLVVFISKAGEKVVFTESGCCNGLITRVFEGSVG